MKKITAVLLVVILATVSLSSCTDLARKYKVLENLMEGESYKSSSDANMTGETVKAKLVKKGELVTYEYSYTHFESLNTGNRKFFKTDMKIPFTSSKCIYGCDGVIKAGIDCKEISVEQEGKSFTITLPKAKIISSEIDMKSFKMYDEKKNFLNPISPDDIVASFDDVKSYEETAAIEKGLLDKANQNAKTSINDFLKDVKAGGYEIKFADAQ